VGGGSGGEGWGELPCVVGWWICVAGVVVSWCVFVVLLLKKSVMVRCPVLFPGGLGGGSVVFTACCCGGGGVGGVNFGGGDMEFVPCVSMGCVMWMVWVGLTIWEYVGAGGFSWCLFGLGPMRSVAVCAVLGCLGGGGTRPAAIWRSVASMGQGV
jgi:hypothetical protein